MGTMFHNNPCKLTVLGQLFPAPCSLLPRFYPRYQVWYYVADFGDKTLKYARLRFIKYITTFRMIFCVSLRHDTL